jgi:hypothetical protein
MLLFGTASALGLMSLLGLVALLGRLGGFLFAVLLIAGSPWCLDMVQRVLARIRRDPAWRHPARDLP